MSIKAMNWVFELPLKPTPKLILLSLADMADDNGYCFPAHKTIARKSSVSVSTVKRALDKMQQQGLITKRIRRNGRENLSNGYALSFADITSVQCEPTSAQIDTPPVHLDEPTSVHPHEPVTTNNLKTSHTFSDAGKIETPEQFDQFFSPSMPKNTRQFAMRADWQPDEHFIGQAQALGVNVTALTQHDGDAVEQALVEFRTYWMEQRPFERATQRFWQQRFINNLKRQFFSGHAGSHHVRSSNSFTPYEQRHHWSENIFNAPGCESIEPDEHAAIFGE